MKQFYLLLSIVFFCTSIAQGQVIISSQDFEAVPAAPTLTFSSTGPGNFTSGASSNNANPVNANLFATGLRGWGSEGGTSVITFANQPITPLIDGFVDFRIAGIGLNNGAGIDPGDVATVAISVNNGTYSNELTLAASSNKQYWDFNAPGYALITYDGNNIPTAFTSSTVNGISRIIIKIPNTFTQVRLRITLNSGSNELWVIDDVKVGSATKYWDGNGTTAGVGFSNSWGNTFSTDASGSSATVASTLVDDINYQGTAGTVSLAASQNVSSHIMNVNGYQFATSGAGARTLDGSFNLNANNIGFVPIAGADLTLTGVISGTGAAGSVIFSKTGAGALILSSPNTFTGKLSITQGIVEGADINSFGAAPGFFREDQILLNGGGIRNTTGSSIIVNGNRGVTLGGGGGTVEASTGGDITLSTVVTGTGSFTKTGPGNVFFNANNTYTGNTIISAGTAILSAANRIANGSNMVLNGGTFSTGAGNNETIGTLSVTANSTINLGTANHSLNFSSAPAAFTGRLTISGWIGAINVTGPNGKIFIGNSIILTQAQRDSIQFSGYLVGAVTQLATGEVVPSGTLSPDYFRSNVISGSWNSTFSWQSSTDSIFWIPASLTPTTNSNSIEIRAGNTISIPSQVNLDETIINGTLDVQTGGRLNLTNGTGDDIIVGTTGILRFAAGTATYAATVNPAAGATVSVFSGGRITIGARGAVGTGFVTLATSNIITWQSGSIFEWNSTSTFAAGNYFSAVNATTIPIFRISSSPATSPTGTFIINGIIEVNANTTFGGTANQTFRDGITGSATLTLLSTLGTVEITSPAAVLGGTGLTLVLNKQLNFNDNVTVPGGANVTVSTTSTSDIVKVAGKIFTVNGTIDFTDRTINNTGGGSILINGTFKTSKTQGLYGTGSTIATSTAPVINPGSTVEYNAMVDQAVTTSVNYFNVVFSGSGIKTPVEDLTATNAVYITGTATVNSLAYNLGDAGTNFTMDGGRLIVGTGGTQPKMDGTYNLTGGVVEFATGTSPKTIRTKAYQNIEVSGNNVANSAGNIELNHLGTFTVKTGGIFTSSNGNSSIVGTTGTQTLTVENNATFRCAIDSGFYGAASGFGISSASVRNNIESINLNVGSTVEYARETGVLPGTATNGQQVISIPYSNAVPIAYQNLGLSGDGNKTAPLGTLMVQGDLVKTGTPIFLHNNGAVLLNGMSNQNFAGLEYNILEMTNATKSLVGGASIRDSIKLNASTSLSIAATDSMVLKSTSSKTARVGMIPASANINGGAGKFVVERYIVSGRRWRYLSIPTDDVNQTFKSAWQEGATTISPNPKPAFGFTIGDVVNPDGVNGFDVKTLNGPVVKTHVSSSNTYLGIPSGTGTNTKIKTLETARGNHLGYMAFVPGDRSVVAFNQSGSTTLRSSGKLYVGAQSVTILSGTDPNFRGIGNPYASPINMMEVLNPAASPGNGIAPAYFIYDPRAAQLGAFITLLWDGNDFKVTTFGSAAFPFDSKQNHLESGAGFFVQASSAGATINFAESAKGSMATQLNFTAGVPERLYASLSRVSPNGQVTVMDGLMARFDSNYSNNVDNLDILKMTNTSETVGLYTSGKKMSVEQRAIIAGKDTLHIHMSTLVLSNYKWDITSDNLDFPGRTGFLLDRYLNTSTPLNLAGTTTVNFNVANIAGSYAADRFKIVFNQPDLGPLPVTITTVTASRKANRSIDVAWKVEDEVNISSYEVQRSGNGSNFTSIQSRAALANNGGRATYLHNDLMALPADNFYRIKANSIGGQVQYSAVAKVAGIKTTTSISVYPNPVTGKQLQVRFNGVEAGIYQLTLVNTAGQVIHKASANVATGSSVKSIQLDNDVAAGRYDLLITTPDGKQSNIQIIIQ